MCLIRAHNPKVIGSNPIPATSQIKGTHEHGEPPFFIIYVILCHIVWVMGDYDDTIVYFRHASCITACR